jgi:two-component system KDP operon response regulator KdpE
MRRILIVEDERPLLRALGAHLEARGYEVDLVETGEAALSCGATSVHDAAIVDLGLPGIDGL